MVQVCLVVVGAELCRKVDLQGTPGLVHGEGNINVTKQQNLQEVCASVLLGSDT